MSLEKTLINVITAIEAVVYICGGYGLYISDVFNHTHSPAENVGVWLGIFVGFILIAGVAKILKVIASAIGKLFDNSIGSVNKNQ